MSDTGATPADAATAQQQIAVHQADGAFMGRLFSGDAEAKTTWDRLYQTAYSTPQDGHGAPRGPAAPDRQDRTGGLSAEDLARGVPPDANGYAIPPQLAVDLPNTASALTSWARESRLDVATVSELARRIQALADEPNHADAMFEDKGRWVLERMASTAEGRRVVERAQIVWRDLERQVPGLAELLLEVGAAADEGFISALGRTPGR